MHFWKLDVGGAVGHGMLRVIKDMGLKDFMWTGGSGDWRARRDDLTYYFATSEQVPSSVGLGVLMEKDNTVKQAGGFIQLMPFTDEKVKQIERFLRCRAHDQLNQGMTPEDILNELLESSSRKISEKVPGISL